MTINRDILGKYIHKKVRSHYIELKPDGTYFLFEGSTSITGTFEVNGSDITIIGDQSTSVGKIKKGVIIDSQGDKWVRSETTPTTGNDPLASMTWLPSVLRRDDFPWELVDVGGLILLIVVGLVLAR
jgi:hypothetical protein